MPEDAEEEINTLFPAPLGNPSSQVSAAANVYEIKSPGKS